MKPIPNREEKVRYLYERQNGLCAIAMHKGKVIEANDELHHLYTDTAKHREKCPLLIHSVWNLVLVNHQIHIANPGALGVTDYRAVKREAFLRRHPRIARWVNFPVGKLFHVDHQDRHGVPGFHGEYGSGKL